MEACSAKLSVTTIPVDEKHPKELQTFQQKTANVLGSLEEKGIAIQLEAPKVPVAGLLRAGYVVAACIEKGRLYDELREEIERCMKSEGKQKGLTKTEKERTLNIALDADNAVSSIDHDYFITCDWCLSESWRKIIEKHKKLMPQISFPEIIHSKRSPEEVAGQILAHLSCG